VPLIRAIKAFFDRRNEPRGPQVDRSPDLGMAAVGGQTTAVLWLVVVVVTLPAVAWLVFVGLIYEAVIRVDRSRRLPEAVPWAIAVLVGVAVVVALAWWFVGR
jgi:hypothetical protein